MRALTRGIAIGLAFLLAPIAGRAETIKIGLLLELSGPSAALGKPIDDAVRLFVKQHEKDILPHKIEIVRRDLTGPAPDIAKRLAQELITRDRVHILAGVVYTPNANAIAPLATEAKIPFIIMNAGTSMTTTLSPYIARVSFTLWQTSLPMGEWAARKGMKKAYTAVSDYGPGLDAEAAFTKGFTAGGGQIVGSVRMPLTTPDYVPFIQRIKDAAPEALFVFVPAGKDATAFMKSYGERGLKEAGITLIATGDLTPEEELPNMGDVPLGLVTSHHYSVAHDSAVNKAFVDSWIKEYGPGSTPNFMSVGGWDGMAAIFQIIKQLDGKIDGDKAMAVLKGWKTESPRGPIAIDPETRDVVQNVYLRRTEKIGGKLQNTEFESISAVKDPWKALNPQ